MESRSALAHALGLELKPPSQPFAKWSEAVQAAYETTIAGCRGDADRCELLETARSVLTHDECYELYAQIWCGPTLYAVLGLRPSCEPQEVKKAYRKLMMRAHVDKRMYQCTRLRAQATRDSQRVTRAYDVLSNHRAQYDARKGFDFNPQQPESDDGDDVAFDPDAWARGGSECEEAAPGDDAEQEARKPRRKRKRASSRARRPRRRRRAPSPEPQREPPSTTQRVELICTLRDLYRGLRRRFAFAKGFEGGDGAWFNRTTTIDLRIPARTPPGVFQVLKGYGQFNHRTQACDDLEIHLAASGASAFRCEGADLVRAVDVGLVAALAGGSFTVELPDGETAQCEFDDMLRTGDRKVVPGKGMRTAGGGHGNVVCEVRVVYGEWTTRQRKALATALTAIRSADPLAQLDMIERITRPAAGSLF